MHPLRHLTLILTAAWLVLPSLGANAALANSISIGSSLNQPCVPTDVAINLDSGAGGIGFDVTVTFDPAVVTVTDPKTDVVLGSGFASCSDGFVDANIVSPGVMKIAAICVSPITAPAELVVITFTPVGNSSTSLALSACKVNDDACTTQNGTFSVACPATPTPTQTPLPTPTPTCTDTDGDGFCNGSDNCPFTSNPDQLDRGGIGTGSPADGIGDACQCGDVNGDGRVLTGDSTIILRSLLNPPTATRTKPLLCDVGGTAGCFTADATIILRRLLNPPTATIFQNCPPAQPPVP